MDQAKRGAALLEANNPLEAVSAYTKALIEHPTSPDYFIQRSTAFTRLSPPRHGPALQDAEKAVLYGHQRSKRASIQAAQHRRVVSLYNLGRYADAKHLLETMRPWVDKEDKKGNMQIDMWMSKANNKLKTATDEQKAVSVEEKPSIELPSEKQRANILRRQIKPDGSYNFDWENEEVTATPAVTATESATSQPANSTSNTSAKAPTTTSKIRHEWYQNAQSVIVTLYAKGVSKDKAEVDIQDDSVSSTLLDTGQHLRKADHGLIPSSIRPYLRIVFLPRSSLRFCRSRSQHIPGIINQSRNHSQEGYNWTEVASP